MTKFVHIVYVHPVELGEPNLYKVKQEFEFDTLGEANGFTKLYNGQNEKFGLKAVYYGCVNDATGELV